MDAYDPAPATTSRDPERPVLFLAHVPDGALDDDAAGPWRELFLAADDLVFVDSEQSRSIVYHALKDQLPPGSPLLVTVMPEVPKFKGLRPGALAWARRRIVP